MLTRIPTFTERGLLPPGIHPCDLRDVYFALCWNSRRLMLLEFFKQFLSCIATRAGRSFPYWIGGSFTTKKEEPKDIDCLLDISAATQQEEDVLCDLLRYRSPDFRRTHYVDFWCYVNDSIPNDRRLLWQGLSTVEKASPEHDGIVRGILRLE